MKYLIEIFITQKVLESIGKRGKGCGIFFDIQSAFDKIWHNGLIFKLVKLKLPYYIIVWLQNFLSNRKFRIRVGDYKTNLTDIECGVPQGAVLSPLLFSIYINDIPLFNKPPNNYSLLFADDLIYLHLFSKINDQSAQCINNQLSKLESWLNNWRLKMAPEKCNYSIFSKYFRGGDKGKKGFNTEKFDLKFFNKSIQLNNEPTFLGVRFDKFFTFKNQIKHVRGNCIKRLNIIKVLSHKSWKINNQTLITIYKSLIRSLIDYSLFLFPILSPTNQKKLQSIQNNALRIIFRKKYDFDANILHESAKIDNLASRSKKLLENYINNATTNKNPLFIDLKNEYISNKNTSTRTFFLKFIYF